MSDWSAASYERFADERTRPIRDLLAALPPAGVRDAVDLGCGSGISTALLALRCPDAVTEGIDSAPDMIRAARLRLPGRRFTLGTIENWSRGVGIRDLVLANASLQWVGEHATLLPRLLGRVRPGGHLAVQVPDNLDEPAHLAMRRVAAGGAWAPRLAEAVAHRAPIADFASYHRLLRPACRQLELWRTVYVHVLSGPDAIVDWFRGTGLLPFLAPLSPDERHDFLARYRAEVAREHPPLADGAVLLPMPRLFLLATR